METQHTRHRMVDLAWAATAGLLAILSIPGALEAQERADRGVTIDWASQSYGRLDRIRAGDAVRIVVSGLSKVCFDYSVSVDLVEAAQESIDVSALLAGTLGAAGSPPPDAGEPDGDDPQGPPRAAFNAFLRSPLADTAEVRRLDAAVNLAATDLAALSKEVASAAAHAQKIDEAVSEMRSGACPPGSRGQPVGADNPHLASAKTEIASLAAELQSLGAYKTRLAAVQKRLSDAESSLPGGSDWGTALPRLIDRLQADAARVQSGPLAALEKQSRGQLRTLEAGLDASVGTDSLVRVVLASPTTASLNVTITAKGKAGVEPMKDAKLEDAYQLPVERRTRVFLTLGFIASSMDEKKYERVNRVREIPPDPPATGGEGGQEGQEAEGAESEAVDSVYSTWADTRGGSSLAFSPAAFVNVSLRTWSDVSLLASAGVAARSVNATPTPPDFLVGLAVGFLDRVVVSGSLHFGRVETLLLGADEEIKARPIPASITRESAVGTRWLTRLALGVSLRP